MSEWQDIDTAPVGKLVHLGKWHDTPPLVWVTHIGMAFEWRDGPFPWSKKRADKTFDGQYYSHWKPAPPPPI